MHTAVVLRDDLPLKLNDTWYLVQQYGVCTRPVCIAGCNTSSTAQPALRKINTSSQYILRSIYGVYILVVYTKGIYLPDRVSNTSSSAACGVVYRCMWRVQCSVQVKCVSSFPDHYLLLAAVQGVQVQVRGSTRTTKKKVDIDAPSAAVSSFQFQRFEIS